MAVACAGSAALHVGLFVIVMTGDGSGWWKSRAETQHARGLLLVPEDELAGITREVEPWSLMQPEHLPEHRPEHGPEPEPERTQAEREPLTPEAQPPEVQQDEQEQEAPALPEFDALVRTVRPGIDDGDKDSPAWIGAHQATPHSGLRSQVDQAARSLKPGAPGPIGDGALPQPEPDQAARASRNGAGADQEEVVQASTDQDVEIQAEPSDQLEASHEAEERESITQERDSHEHAEPTETTETDEIFGVPERLPLQARELRREASKQVKVLPGAVTLEQLVRALQRRTDIAPVEAATSREKTPGGDLRQPGEASESESIATTTQVTLTYKPGQPLAGEGLAIRTVQPKFGITTRLLRAAKSPTVDVVFDRTGKVTVAQFAKGENAGHPDIDEPILDAVYRWTASGRLLSEVSAAPGAGLHVRINFLLH